jgi:threonine dehydratase
MTASPVPDLADVLAARQRIAPYLRPTPLHRYPALDAMTGAQVQVKHENHQPAGAFKVRGGVNLVSQLTADERAGVSSPPRPATTASRWRMRRTCSACGR